VLMSVTPPILMDGSRAKSITHHMGNPNFKVYAKAPSM
jgi:hypothetical protein